MVDKNGEDTKHQAMLDAVKSLFGLCETIQQNQLTLNDLVVALDMVLENEHDTVQMNLSLMSLAVCLSREKVLIDA